MSYFHAKFLDLYYRFIARESLFFSIIFVLFILIVVTPLTTLIISNVEKNKAGNTQISFFEAKIIASDTLTSGRRTRVRISVQLPDGSKTTVMTTNSSIYGQLNDTACIRFTEEIGTDRNWISLASSSNCS